MRLLAIDPDAPEKSASNESGEGEFDEDCHEDPDGESANGSEAAEISPQALLRAGGAGHPARATFFMPASEKRNG